MSRRAWISVRNDTKLPKKSHDKAKNSLCLENSSSKILGIDLHEHILSVLPELSLCAVTFHFTVMSCKLDYSRTYRAE